MRASEPSTADDTGLKEQAVTRRAFVSFGRLSDGQPGKCTESSSGHRGEFTERPSVRREPALLAGRRKVTLYHPGRASTRRWSCRFGNVDQVFDQDPCRRSRMSLA